jgi:antitoxin component YwqK of YwqJK toxin-antitoxin module
MRPQIAFCAVMLLAFTACMRVQTDRWPNGNLKSSISMRGESYHGPASWYYEDGTLQMECSYRNNLLEGRLMRYYSSGMKKEEVYYKQNKADSVYKFWDVAGYLLVEAFYHDSLLDGKFLEYYPGGGPLKTEGSYKNGMYEGKWFWYDGEGAIAGTGDFTDGEGLQRSFYPDGTVQQIIRFRDNLKDGPEDYYNTKGEVTEIRIYRKGNLIEIKNVKKI